MQPAETRWAPAHRAQVVFLLLQHAPGLAGLLHGDWLSVSTAPTPPPGSGAASFTCCVIIIVQVVLPAGGRPMQCSCPSSSSCSQRVKLSTGLLNVSSKASSMKSQPAEHNRKRVRQRAREQALQRHNADTSQHAPPLVSAPRAASDSVPWRICV